MLTKLSDFIESLFVPIIYFFLKILNLETEYQKGEELILLVNIGEDEKSPNYIPRNSKVKFFKLADNPNDLTRSMVAIEYDNRVLVIPEVDVKIPSYLRRKKIQYDFSHNLMKGSPRLRKYHPFFFLKMFYTTRYFISDLFGGRK